MKLGFYFDDNCDDRVVVEGLRRAGITVVRPVEVGLSGAPDADHLAFAASRGLTLFTANEADFERLNNMYAAGGTRHSGIIIMKQKRLGRGEQIRRLMRVFDEVDAEEIERRVEYLSRWGPDS